MISIVEKTKPLGLRFLMANVSRDMPIPIAKESLGKENYTKLIKEGMIWEVGDKVTKD